MKKFIIAIIFLTIGISTVCSSSRSNTPTAENKANASAGEPIKAKTVEKKETPKSEQTPDVPTSKTPEISGTYIYESKHEYGSDKYYWEFSSDNTAVFSGEVEGGDFPNESGKWAWDENKREITVTMSGEKNGVYNFKLEGRNLKLIKEPKLPQGVTGFVGTIFRKK